MRGTDSRTPGLLLVLLLLASACAGAEQFAITTDVPTPLGTATYLANQIVERSGGSYSLSYDGTGDGLGPDVNLNALVLLEDGSFLFSTDAPFESRGVYYEARDVVRYDSGLFYMHVDGGSLGLAPDANLDALARDIDGDLVFSVDEPEFVVGLQIAPGDLAVIDTQSDNVLLLATTTDLQLPNGADIVGLEREDAGAWFVMFDIPTHVGTTTYLPGEIVRLENANDALFFSEPDFPAGNAGAGLSFPDSPGEALQLRASRSGADVDLTWQPSCSAEAIDYAIYEGSIGSWYDHDPVVCSTAGATAATVAPDSGDRYFLVVPQSAVFEGSYGVDSASVERPSTAGACLDMRRAAACP
ncbi:MAG: hypothetical protein GY716_14700 [bacterium]|nr:hypothetical protein [bacterium]